MQSPYDLNVYYQLLASGIQNQVNARLANPLAYVTSNDVPLSSVTEHTLEVFYGLGDSLKDTFWGTVDLAEGLLTDPVHTVENIGSGIGYVATHPREVWHGLSQEWQSGDIRERSHMIGNAVQMLVPVTSGAIKFGTSLSKFGVFGSRLTIGAESLPNFASRDLLESHFIEHGAEFKGDFNTADEYLSGAHDVIRSGIKVVYDYKGETRIGYIRFAGTTQGKTLLADIKQPGLSKFEFVGTNNSGKITTYHIERGRNAFWKMLNNSVIKNITPFDFFDDDLEIISQNNLR